MNEHIVVTAEKLPKSMMKLTIQATAKDLADATEHAYTRLSKDVDVRGFRKGTAPKPMILEELGAKLVDEAINFLIWDLSNRAIAQEKLTPLSKPEFSINSFIPEQSLSFSLTFAVYPTVTIGDLSTIKVDKQEIEKAQEARKAHESHDHEHHHEDEHTEEETKQAAKGIGLDKYYSEIIDKILTIAPIEIPPVVIDDELANYEQNFHAKLKDLGIAVDQYLKLQNTTLEQARANWKKDIEFSLKQDILLAQYAKDKNITVSDDEVKKSLDQVYSPEQMEKLDPKMYDYARYSLVRQKAFTHLIDFIEANNDHSNSN